MDNLTINKTETSKDNTELCVERTANEMKDDTDFYPYKTFSYE